MRPDSIRLKSAHRYFLYAVLGLLFLSGVVWACFNYLAISPNELGSTSKSFAIRIHGGAAMAILVLIGTLLNAHVKFAWRAGRNRINGALFLGALGILTLTGYGLYYAGSETLRRWTSWIHLAVGLILPVLLIVHIFVGKGTRPAVQVRKRHHFQAKIDIYESS